MATRTGQFIHIAEVTGSMIYSRESETRVQGSAKALILSLEQFHAHYYRFYKNRIARAMVGLQVLHSRMPSGT